MLADDTVEHVMFGVSRARSQLGSSPAEEYRARRNLPMSKAWIRWVMASTHETPERGGAPALGGAAYEPLDMEVQHHESPLGAGTRIGSDGNFKPKSKGSVCRQVVAGPRFEPATHGFQHQLSRGFEVAFQSLIETTSSFQQRNVPKPTRPAPV